MYVRSRFRNADILVQYKGSGRGGLSPPPSSVVRNALVVIDDGIESVNVKNRYQGARVSARRANREPEDGIRWKFVYGRIVVVRWYGIKWLASSPADDV